MCHKVHTAQFNIWQTLARTLQTDIYCHNISPINWMWRSHQASERDLYHPSLSKDTGGLHRRCNVKMMTARSNSVLLNDTFMDNFWLVWATSPESTNRQTDILLADYWKNYVTVLEVLTYIPTWLAPTCIYHHALPGKPFSHQRSVISIFCHHLAKFLLGFTALSHLWKQSIRSLTLSGAKHDLPLRLG